MATRGTYQIIDKTDYGSSVTSGLLYNHWDNYPEGAAWHISCVLKQAGGRLSYVDMIRCQFENGPEFTPTTSKFDGPAEWHYNIEIEGDKEIFITVYKVTSDDELKPHTTRMEVHEFLNKYLEDDKGNHPKKWVRFTKNSFTTYPVYRDKDDLYQAGIKALQSGFIRLIKGHTGNASSELSEGINMVNASGCKDLNDGYNKLIASYLADKYTQGDPKRFQVSDTSEDEEPNFCTVIELR